MLVSVVTKCFASVPINCHEIMSKFTYTFPINNKTTCLFTDFITATYLKLHRFVNKGKK